ncbi:leucine-rich repeat flightless-interacting protein 1 isoform X3 [Parambassis ranga]|uniref:Leucine-rich repeat flightless-interacting protein 1 isoform X3 n=1 Tax=Parambassis ranga TaxID=210632 RepID=A0A6P7HY59_9TELE|nr:leucine-rich repeat flightless-interacting protein 1-like isoform X3 [Parambassis ranga]
MGTQGPGRKRIPNREKLTAEDDALNQIAREAEARLAAKRAARAEAREIRMKELERQQKEEDSERYARHSRRHASISDDEERMSVGSRGSLRPSDYSGFLGSGSRASSRASSARASPVVEDRTDFLDKGSRTASTLSAATLASLGGASSRRGSCDTSFSVETEASIREMKDSLAESDEKYRKAMVSNAQLHNEKSALMYQVDTLKEELSDMEELLWETRRHYNDKTKEFERERQAHSVLQFQFTEMKETLRHTEELLTEVSDLRLKSSSYCQEVSDLQEALQWKEKKIGALERQREISDIVRIERNQLRDEVVRLRDALKVHGVIISSDVTTNGDTGQDGAESDVSAESVTHLAQEGGRESMLESSKDNRRFHRWTVYKRSGSLNEQTFKEVKEADRQTRERPHVTEKHPKGNKQPATKGSEMDPPGSPRTQQHRLRSGQAKKKPMKKSGGGCALAEAEQEYCKVIGKPKQGQTHTGRYEQLASPFSTAANKRVLKSRLVPPRPAKDILLENRAFVSLLVAKKHSVSKQRQNVSARNHVSAVDHDSETSEITSEKCDLMRCLEEMVVPDSPVCVEGKNTPGSGHETAGWTSYEDGASRSKSDSSGCSEDPSFATRQKSTEDQFPLCPADVDVPGRPEDRKHWISENNDDKESMNLHTMDHRLAAEDETHLMNLPEPSKATKDPEHVNMSIADHEPSTAVTSCCEEFVFIDSYFAEPVVSTAEESRSDVGVLDSSTRPERRDRIGAMKARRNQRAQVWRSRSCLLVPAEDSKELKRSRALSANAAVAQSSKVRRLIKATAEEIKNMVVPELAVMRFQDGRQTGESSGLDADFLEEWMAADMDSCEEVEEDLALHQESGPVILEGVEVIEWRAA